MTAMEEALTPISEGSVEPPGIEAIRRRAKQLSEMQRNRLNFVETSSDSKKVLEDMLIEFQNRSKQFEWEDPNVVFSGLEDLESYVGHLEKEFQFVEDENSRISEEIGALTRTIAEDSVQLDSDLEGLNCSLNLIVLEGVDKCQTGALDGVSISRSSQGSMRSAWEGHKLEILELDHRIETSSLCLNLLKDLDFLYKRVEAVGQIEDMLSEVKAIKFDKNCIALTIRMPIPTSYWLLLGQKLDYAIEPSVLDYELSIEIVDGTIEVKNVKIFPSDVSLDGVIDATKSLRQFFSSTSVPIVRSSLEWLVTQVHQRILFAFLRHSMVRDANKSRHSFEYSDRDETVTAHLVGGIDAFIKISDGWPVSRSSLKLISVKNLAVHSTSISLGFLCKVKELANSLDLQIRRHLVRFADAIEEILIRETEVSR